MNESSQSVYENMTDFMQMFLVEGRDCFQPGKGGNGGVGGIGGNSGKILIIGLDKEPNFNISQAQGEMQNNIKSYYIFKYAYDRKIVTF